MLAAASFTTTTTFVAACCCLILSLFTVPSCQTDIGECSQLKPCLNNGTCSEPSVGEYFCNCNATEYTGVNCSVPIINDCSISPCKNNATCTNTTDAYNCTCLPGYDGETCDHEINDCIDIANLCSLNSTCVWHQDLQNHTCKCNATGYEGVNCTQEINECLSSPCQNGATCNDFLSFYNCSCDPGFKSR